MKHTLPLLALFVTSGISAQPVFTAANSAPDIGQTLTVHTASYVAPGPATANFTFDASASTVGPGSATVVLAPSATPYASSFPQAQFAEAALTNPQTYAYASSSSTAETNWGFYGTQSHVILTNGEELLHFPCSMGTTWTDAYSGNGSNAGQSFTRAGSITVSYNGYGTLILPFGTFTNVSRLEYNETFTDTFSGYPIVSGTANVAYGLPDLGITLFSCNSVLVDYGDGLDTIQQFSTMIDPTEVGIAESRGIGQNALLYPNPANDAFTLTFAAPVSDRSTITLIDAVGKEVMKLEPSMANATTMHFDVSSVPRGMYIVRLLDAQGRSSNMPLVLR